MNYTRLIKNELDKIKYGCSYGAKIKWRIIYMQSHAMYVQSYDTYVQSNHLYIQS